MAPSSLWFIKLKGPPQSIKIIVKLGLFHKCFGRLVCFCLKRSDMMVFTVTKMWIFNWLRGHFHDINLKNNSGQVRKSFGDISEKFTRGWAKERGTVMFVVVVCRFVIFHISFFHFWFVISVFVNWHFVFTIISIFSFWIHYFFHVVFISFFVFRKYFNFYLTVVCCCYRIGFTLTTGVTLHGFFSWLCTAENWLLLHRFSQCIDRVFYRSR